MDARDLLQLFGQRWRLIVALMVLGSLAGATYSLLTKPTYSSTTELYVSSTNPSDVSSGQYLVKSYTELVHSREMLKRVSSETRLQRSVDELANSVQADNPRETMIINVVVQDRSPQDATLLANAIGRMFPDYVRSLESNGTNGPGATTIHQVSEATFPSQPTEPQPVRDIALGAAAGLLLSLVLIGFTRRPTPEAGGPTTTRRTPDSDRPAKR